MAKRRIRRKLLYAGAICGALITSAIATCSFEAGVFNRSASQLPCKKLNLPKESKPLSESICIAVSGEQPKKIGVEKTDLGNKRTAHTLFLEWNFDGVTEGLRKEKPDSEPITLITEDGKPAEVHVRSHWRVGVYDFDSCKLPTGKVVVAVANAFHTPVVVSECESRISDPKKKGGINTLVFKAVSDYARAVGQWCLDTFRPLKSAKVNEVPGPDHPARTQPLFVR